MKSKKTLKHYKFNVRIAISLKNDEALQVNIKA